MLDLYSDFSSYQKHRHKFVPATPPVLAECGTGKVTLHDETYAIEEKLSEIFPTLIGQGLKYYEFRKDEENGEILKSDTPLNVRTNYHLQFSK